jgi:hypothetical protein
MKEKSLVTANFFEASISIVNTFLLYSIGFKLKILTNLRGSTDGLNNAKGIYNKKRRRNSSESLT